MAVVSLECQQPEHNFGKEMKESPGQLYLWKNQID